MNLQQPSAFGPFMRHPGVFSRIAWRTSEHNVLWPIASVARYGDRVINLVPVLDRAVTVVAFALLSLVHIAYILRLELACRAQLSPAAMLRTAFDQPYLVGIGLLPRSCLSIYFVFVRQVVLVLVALRLFWVLFLVGAHPSLYLLRVGFISRTRFSADLGGVLLLILATAFFAAIVQAIFLGFCTSKVYGRGRVNSHASDASLARDGIKDHLRFSFAGFAYWWCGQAAKQAVRAVHEAALVHADILPQNGAAR
jgi:hypothetical protein